VGPSTDNVASYVAGDAVGVEQEHPRPVDGVGVVVDPHPQEQRGGVDRPAHDRIGRDAEQIEARIGRREREGEVAGRILDRGPGGGQRHPLGFGRERHGRARRGDQGEGEREGNEHGASGVATIPRVNSQRMC
jgi:hypothetical protein